MEAGLIKTNSLAIIALGLAAKVCFGAENFERLGRRKKKVDLGNVFKFVPAKLV
jgi:hypothetical protein